MNGKFESVSFATLNVRGMRAQKRRHQLHRLILEESPDILAIQESKLATEEHVDEALRPFLSLYEICVSHATGVSAGCLLFLKKSLPLSNLNIVTDEEGRFILSDFVLFGSDWRVICIYAPNNNCDRLSFFTALLPYCQCERKCVIMGDYNCVCDVADRSGSAAYIDSSAKFLAEMIDQSDFLDVGKHVSRGGQLKFTRP